MHRPWAQTARLTRPSTRTARTTGSTRAAAHRLTRTDRTAINRLAGNGRRLRTLRHTRTRRGRRGLTRDGPILLQTRDEIRTRRDDRARSRLTGERRGTLRRLARLASLRRLRRTRRGCARTALRRLCRTGRMGRPRLLRRRCSWPRNHRRTWNRRHRPGLTRRRRLRTITLSRRWRSGLARTRQNLPWPRRRSRAGRQRCTRSGCSRLRGWQRRARSCRCLRAGRLCNRCPGLSRSLRDGRSGLHGRRLYRGGWRRRRHGRRGRYRSGWGRWRGRRSRCSRRGGRARPLHVRQRWPNRRKPRRRRRGAILCLGRRRLRRVRRGRRLGGFLDRCRF